MMQLRTGVIGVGYLGSFHAEKLAAMPRVELVAVADIDPDRAHRVARQLGARAVFDYRQLFGQVDAVIVAVPTRLHYEVAAWCLAQGLHVLLEKPIATTVEQAQALINLTRRHNRVLQIGHLERFNPAILAVEQMIQTPLFIESHRLAPFKTRGTDTNVVLDLMIHDIDIILKLVDTPVSHIDANGIAVLSSAMDIANARIRFANGCVANVTASRVSFKSERKMRLFQADAYMVVDFQNRSLDIHRKGEGEAALNPSMANITSEQRVFAEGDALQAEIAAFVDAIHTGAAPSVSGEDGKRALATAIEITRQVTTNFTLDRSAAQGKQAT